ncbi:MAG TPA: hypothetical protein VN088_19040 [Nocardioides sp.]|nr:hypothetical protein [Nocardioides sp.]
MAFQARVGGADGWATRADAILARVRTASDGAVDDGLAMVQQSAQQNLRHFTHPPGTPTPSAPGDPPALISGTLLRSVKARRTSTGPNVFAGKVGSTVIYGPPQERGARTGRGHHTILPPRPWLRPAAFNALPKAGKHIISAWTRAIRG